MLITNLRYAIDKNMYRIIWILDEILCTLFLLSDYSGISLTKSQVNIPDELKICYVNNNMQDFHLPMNLRVLLDIIRKAERYSYSAMDLRIMSSSLMHRYELLI